MGRVGASGEGKHGRLSPLLGEALDLLGDPAHSRAPLLLLGQHRHQGLGEQVCVLPVAHHFLEKYRERVWGFRTVAITNMEKRARLPQSSCVKGLPRKGPCDPDIPQRKGALHV